MVDTTTIRVQIKTQEEMDNIKVHPRETYDDVIRRLLMAFEMEDSRDIPDTLKEVNNGR